MELHNIPIRREFYGVGCSNWRAGIVAMMAEVINPYSIACHCSTGVAINCVFSVTLGEFVILVNEEAMNADGHLIVSQLRSPPLSRKTIKGKLLYHIFTVVHK